LEFYGPNKSGWCFFKKMHSRRSIYSKAATEGASFRKLAGAAAWVLRILRRQKYRVWFLTFGRDLPIYRVD
jgi:hypothetical protein